MKRLLRTQSSLRAHVQTVADAEHMQIGYQAMARLIALPRRPRAVFCTSDPIADGAQRFLAKAGLQVGRDVVLVGFDDSPMNPWVAPWLNAVRVPYAEFGAAIVRSIAAEVSESIILAHAFVSRPVPALVPG